MTPQLPGVAFICIYVHIKPGGTTCRGANGESTCFDMHSEKTDGLFFLERSHAYQSTRPLLLRQTSTQRLEETGQQSYGGLEEKNRKSAAMEFYSPRPFNGPFNTASSAADTSQAPHLAAAIAQTASQYSARPYTHPHGAQSQNERLSEQIKVNKGSDASACKKQKACVTLLDGGNYSVVLPLTFVPSTPFYHL